MTDPPPAKFCGGPPYTTVAVNVTLCPTVDGFSDYTSVVVEGFKLTTIEQEAELAANAPVGA